MNGYDKPALSIPELIAKKRDGKRLSSKEVAQFIQKVIDGEMQESQIGAFLHSVCLFIN